MTHNDDEIMTPEDFANIDALGQAMTALLNRMHSTRPVAIITLMRLAGNIIGGDIANRAEFEGMVEHTAGVFKDHANDVWRRKHGSKPN